MLFTLHTRRRCRRAGVPCTRFRLVADLIPSLDAAVDVAARRGPGRYVVGSDCGHLQLALQIDADGILSWRRQRATDAAPVSPTRRKP